MGGKFSWEKKSLRNQFILIYSDNLCNYDVALRRFCVHEKDGWKGIAPSLNIADINPEPPIFSSKFANCGNYTHILAISNEDGMVSFIWLKRNSSQLDELFLLLDCIARYKCEKKRTGKWENVEWTAVSQQCRLWFRMDAGRNEIRFSLR